jgi:hypothetical protein
MMLEIPFARGSTSVSGPGQNAFASLLASAGQLATQRFAMSMLATWTMIGLCAGRPLTWKMRSTARGSSALAASPYTVSVGRATTSPARNSSVARCTAAWNKAGVCVGRTSAIRGGLLSTTGICPQPDVKHQKNGCSAPGLREAPPQDGRPCNRPSPELDAVPTSPGLRHCWSSTKNSPCSSRERDALASSRSVQNLSRNALL